jgi:hypothetical protein
MCGNFIVRYMQCAMKYIYYPKHGPESAALHWRNRKVTTISWHGVVFLLLVSLLSLLPLGQRHGTTSECFGLERVPIRAGNLKEQTTILVGHVHELAVWRKAQAVRFAVFFGVQNGRPIILIIMLPLLPIAAAGRRPDRRMDAAICGKVRERCRSVVQ